MMGMTKENYLKAHIGFTLNDMSWSLQFDYCETVKDLKRDAGWFYLALSQQSLEKWEEYGMGLMYNPPFMNKIDVLWEKYKQMTNEEFQEEMKKSDVVIDENFYRFYEDVKYNRDEYDYSNYLSKTGKDKCEAMLAKGFMTTFSERDKLIFLSGWKKV